MQHENARQSVFGLGRAQIPAEPRVEDDVAAIRELLDYILRLEGDGAVRSREELGGQLESLDAAVRRRDTGSRPAREMLQQVLLDLGIGVLAPLSEPTRRRLAALTGIALPPYRTPSARPHDADRPSREQEDQCS